MFRKSTISSIGLVCDSRRITRLALLFAAFGLFSLHGALAQQVVTETINAGTNSFHVPPGVTKITVEVWGAGGGGGGNTTGSDGGGGGGGGAYSRAELDVTADTDYTVEVGLGGAGGNTDGTAGGDTWFGSAATIMAKGGTGGFEPVSGDGGVAGTGGSAAAGVVPAGGVKFSGGNGGPGRNTSGSSNVRRGGGGGSSAGTAADGDDGEEGPSGAPPLHADGGTAPAGGGDGGDGGEENETEDGGDGMAPGGGGGGGSLDGADGGDGADGKIVITYTLPDAPTGLDLAAADDSNDNTDNITTQTSALSISGSSNPNVSIQLFDDGSTIGTPVSADGAGAWGPIDISLPEGTHAITATATLNGNTGPASSALNITIDNTAPSLDITLDAVLLGSAAGTTDDEVSFTLSFDEPVHAASLVATDDITINAAGVTFTNPGVVGGTSPTYTYTISDVDGNGTLGITVGPAVTDVAGNAMAGAEVSSTFTIDNTPPAFTSVAVSPSTGTVGIGGPVSITLTANGGELGFNGGTITVNGVAGSLTDNADGTYTVAYTPADGDPDWAGGALPISIEVTDDAGNATTISAFTDGNTLAGDANGPAAPTSLDLAAGDDSGLDDTDNITNVTTDLTVSGTAEANATVRLLADDVNIPGATVVADGTTGAWSIDFDLIEGQHDITAIATDAAGNDGAESLVLMITVDDTAPVSPSIPDLDASSDSGTSPTDNVTNDLTPLFTGTAEAGTTVHIYSDLDAASRGSATATGGNYSVIATLLTESNTSVHAITATAVDAAGNESAPSTDLNVTVDATAPEIFGSPALTIFGGSGKETVIFQTTEPIGLANGANVDFVDDGGGVGFEISDGNDDGAVGSAVYATSGNQITITSSAGNSKWQHTTAPISQLSYVAGGNVFDIAGNEFAISPTNVVNGDGTPPVIVGDVMTLFPRAANPEKIVFSLNEEINLLEGAAVTGLTVSPAVTFTANISGVGTTNTVTLVASANGEFTIGTTVSYSGSGNLVDLGGNNLGAVNNHAVVMETVPPSITNVTIPDVAMKVGDIVTAIITTVDDDGDHPTSVSGNIGGFAVGSLTNNSNISKTVTFTVTENGTDVAAGSDIPLSITLTDGQSNASAAYTTAISQTSDPIDANSPEVVGNAVLFPRADNPEKVVFSFDEDIDLTDGAGVTGITVNGSATDFNATFSSATNTVTLESSSNGFFSASSVIAYAGGGNLVDLLGNQATSFASLSIADETVKPVITAVSIPDAPMIVGQNVEVTITTTDDDLDEPVAVSGTIAGFNVTVPITYTSGTEKKAIFTITEGATDIAAGDDIPVASITLTDGLGNASDPFSTTISQANDPIDANSPTIVSITNSDAQIYEGDLVQTVTVVYSENMNTAIQPTITISGTNWGAQTPVGGTNGWAGTTYTAQFTHDGDPEELANLTTSVAVGGAQDAAGNANLGNATSSFFSVDTKKPTALVTVSTGLSIGGIAYLNQDNLVITVQATFSEAMNTAVAPSVTFTSTDGNLTAGTGSWSAGNTVYTIAYTHDGTDEESLTPQVSVNGGEDANGNEQTVAATSTNFVIDTDRPEVASITRVSSTPTNASSVAFSVVFSEAVTAVDATDFTVTALSGSYTPSVGVAGSGTTYTVTVSNLTGDGEIRLDVAGGSANVVDARFNDITADFTSGETYVIDQTAPLVQSVEIITATEPWSDFNGTSATTLQWTVTFSEPVDGVDATDFVIQNPRPPAAVTYNTTPGVAGTGDTRTISVTGVELLTTSGAQLHIDVLDDNTITDDAGNPLGGPLTTDGPFPTGVTNLDHYYTVLFPEPTEAATNFTVNTQSTTSLQIQWTNPASPAEPANYYIAQLKKSTIPAFTDPQDGTYPDPATADADPSDGTLAQPVIATSNLINFSNLPSGFDYDVRIVSASYSGLLGSPAQYQFDFLTTPTLTGSTNTTVGTVSSLATPVTTSPVNSLVTASPGTEVYRFSIDDDGALDATDNAPLKFSSLVIKQGAVNGVADWTDAIAGARLVDSNGEFIDGTVNATNITFTGIPSSDPSNANAVPDLGYVPDDLSKTYILQIWLDATLGVADNSDLAFLVDNASFTYDNTVDADEASQRSSQVSPGSSIESSAVDINVVATKLVFDTGVPAQIGVKSNFPTPPVVHAVDANGNLDTDYSNAFTVAPLASIDNGHTNFSSGVLTLSDFNFNTPTATAITISGVAGGIYPAIVGANAAVSSSVTSVITNLTQISIGPDGEPSEISSLATTPAGDVQVFDFVITDDVGANSTTFEDNDGLPTLITDLVITAGTGNDAALGDWTDAIAGARLTDGSTSRTGTVNTGNITFASMTINAPSGIGYVADDGAKTYRLFIYLKSASAIPDVIDNKDFVFEITSANITTNASPTSSTLQTSDTNSGDGNVAVDVEATQIDFTTQWLTAATQSYDAPLAPSPVAKARDVNGNLDLDYNTAATVASGNATLYPLANDGVTVNNGVFTFEADLQVSSAGDGAHNATTQLTLSSGTLTDGVTNSITLQYSAASDILRESVLFSYPQNIDYADAGNQVPDITDATGIALEAFKVRDGGGTVDADGTPTKLSRIKISVTNYQYLRRIALYEVGDDFSLSNELAEMDVSAGTVTGANVAEFEFTGITAFEAPDNGSRENIFAVKVSFQNANVADNAVVTFEVVEVEAEAISSAFGVPNPVGVASNVTGDENKIEVEATQLDIISPAADRLVSLDAALTPITVQARDANANLDLDYNDPVTELTNASGVAMSSTPAVVGISFASGILNFPADFTFTSGNNNDEVTLSVKAGTGTNCGVDAICSGTSPMLTLKSNTITIGNVVAEPLTISSLINAFAGVPVFDFTVNDDDRETSGTDALPTRISQVIVTQGAGNQVADWSQLIAGALLFDGTTYVLATAINNNNIVFPAMPNALTSDLGHIADNGEKTYQMWMWLRNPLLGTLPSTVDNLELEFEVLATNITLVGGVSSTFSDSESEASGAGKNAIDVDATKLAFTTNPASDLLVNKDISGQLPIPVVEALDANNNRDLDFNSATVTVTNADGSPMTNAPGNADIINGLLTFDNAFQFNAIGDGTLTVAATGPSTVTNAVSTAVTVRVGLSGTITAGGEAEPTTISSLIDSDGEKVEVFDFTINDDPAGTPADENDGNPMLVTAITITQQGGVNTIADWSEAIEGAELSDGTNTLTGTVNGTSIEFLAIPTTLNALGYIGDGDPKEYSLSIYLKSALGGTLPETIDGLVFGFQVLQADITTDPTGTSILAGEDELSGGGNEVAVVATQLDITTPGAATPVSLNEPFSVVVKARDANANVDLDFTGAPATITELTNASGVTMTSTPTVAGQEFTNGVYTFPVDFSFTSGNNNDDVTLSMKAGTGTTCGVDAVCTVISPVLTLKSSTIEPGGLVEPATISSLTTAAPGADVFDFEIRDDDLVVAGTDAEATLITDLVITPAAGNEIADWTELIAGAELFDGTSTHAGVVNADNITFSGLNVGAGGIGEVADNTAKTYTLRIRLHAALMGALKATVDNERVAFEILATNITVTASSSTFSDSESENSGALTNAIDVVATALAFTTQPAADMLVNKDIAPNQLPLPVVEALDANGNRDLDFNSTALAITSAGGLTMTNAPGNTDIINGLLTFNGGFQYDDIGDGSTGNGTLTISAADGAHTVTNAVSTAVTVRVGLSATITPGPLTEPTTISSVADTDGEKIAVFDFEISDDANGVESENDGNPILISQIVITQQANPNNTVSNWSDVIAMAELSDGTNIVAGVVNASNITFAGMAHTPGDIGYIGDNANKTYTLRIYLHATLNSSLWPVIDGQVFGFQVLETDITTDFTGTSIITGENVDSGVANEITVVATQLDFTTPSSATNASLNSPFAVVVQARDENGNLDLDFTAGASTITSLTNVTTADMTSTPPVVGSDFANGVFTFPADFMYTSGANDDDVTLTMDAGTATISGTSPTIILTSSFESVLVVDPNFTPAADIPYIDNQDISDETTSHAVAQLLLWDGDGVIADLDGAATNIDDITLSVTNPENVRSLGIYLSSTLVQSKDNADFVAGTETTVTFENLSAQVIAPDNGNLPVTIRAAFFDTPAKVHDNDAIQFRVLAVSQAGGSRFNDVNNPGNIGGVPGGALTDPEVRIEVTATQLDFVVDPAPIEGIDQPLSVEPEVRAHDANGILDEDFNFAATITVATASLNDPALSFTGGILGFTNVQYDAAGVGTYTVVANGISSDDGPEPSLPVDVIHVSAALLNDAHGVINATNIKAGSSDIVIFGVTFSPDHGTATEPSLQSFAVTFSGPFMKENEYLSFQDFRLYEASTADFGSAQPVGNVTIDELASVNAGVGEIDMVRFTFDQPKGLFGGNISRSFFITAGVASDATNETPEIAPQLIDLGFGDPTDNNIALSEGTATTQLIGQTYTFASTRPPGLVATSPERGQLNVDPAIDTIKLVFDVKVLSFDGMAFLYGKTTNNLIDTLQAVNGVFNGNISQLGLVTVDTLKFLIPPDVILHPDSVYYIGIRQGTYDPLTNKGTGISDEGQNFYGGISYNGTFYFKISSPVAPKMVATDINKYFASESLGIFNGAFDQFGTGYYLVARHSDAGPDPTNDQILSPGTYPVPVVASGSFAITAISQSKPLYQSVAFSAALDPGETYDVWIFAENDAQPTPVRVTAPYGAGPDYSPGTPGPTLQLTVPAATTNLNNPLIEVCPNSSVLITTPIIISENSPGDLSSPSVQNFNVLLPTGFSFNTDHLPTVTFAGQDFVDVDTIFFVNNTLLNIAFTNTGASSIDNIIIRNLEVLGTVTGQILPIRRFAGNMSLTLVPENTELARIFATSLKEQPFTNSYSSINDFSIFGSTVNEVVNFIPDNFIEPSTNGAEVRLVPSVEATNDYGASTFSGPGVTNDLLSLSGVPPNTAFDVVMTHTDLNGCVSTTTQQYMVYDHLNAIPVIGTSECIPNPLYPDLAPHLYMPGDTLRSNAKAGFGLLDLFTKVPPTADSEKDMIFGAGWETVVNRIPVYIQGSPLKDFTWDYSHILNADTVVGANINENPYDHFLETSSGGTFSRGGSLGNVEFIAIYRSTADNSLVVPFRQEVELFVPPMPVLNIAGNSASEGDTLIFCQDQPLIQITGFPLVTPGVSNGVFGVYDVATGNPIVEQRPSPTPSLTHPGFVDNGNGTATLDPGTLFNDYKTLRITYAFEENASPCVDHFGVFYIRIVPNPVANFTFQSVDTPTTPGGTGTCEAIPINFNATTVGTIDSYAWNFDDPNSGEANESDVNSPVHTFNESDAYNVSLTVTSNYGCASSETVSQVSVGAVPEVVFDFRGVSVNDQFAFDINHDDDQTSSRVESAAVLNDGFATLRWTFGEGPEDFGPAVSYKYSEPGHYNVILEITSILGCVASDDEDIVVVPNEVIASSAAYKADFEISGNGSDYQTWPLEPQSSWELGIATSPVIKSSNAVWKTNLDGPYHSGEKSALYTAAFDISGLERPIISLNTFRHLDNPDGVVVQYSVDNRNITDPRKEWLTLGSSTSSGSSGTFWYTDAGLASKPGDQTFGDFGWSSADSTWRESKHTLAAVLGENNVVFRFALASISNTDFDGFAIDNLRIGEGTRMVLLENFTNSGVAESELQTMVTEENEAFRSFYHDGIGVNLVKIQYHVGFPGSDPFNEENPTDPGARALYYNIASVPQARLDGMAGPESQPFSTWGETMFNKRLLDLAEADVDISTPTVADGELTFNVTVTPGRRFTTPTILHVVIVEDSVDVDVNADLQGGRIQTGETIFGYVMRKMLPHAGGTKFSTLDSAVAITIPFRWTDAKLFLPDDDIHIIAFLQDETARTVYQADREKGPDPPTVSGIEDIDRLMKVYPNPADRQLVVELPFAVKRPTTVELFDPVGRTAYRSAIAKGEDRKVIGTEELSAGVYLLQIQTDQGIIRKKVLVVHRN